MALLKLKKIGKNAAQQTESQQVDSHMYDALRENSSAESKPQKSSLLNGKKTAAGAPADSDALIDMPANVGIVKKQMSVSFLKGMAAVFAIAFFTVLCVLVYVVTRPESRFQPVILVDEKTGAQTTIFRDSFMTADTFTPTETLFMNVAKSYINNLRSVSSDVYVNRKQMQDVYAHTTDMAVPVVSEYFEKNNPITRASEERVEISLYSSMLISQSNNNFHYQFDWIERTYYFGSNKLKDEKAYRADIHCKRYKATEESKSINPLGLYVTQLYISPLNVTIEDGAIRL